MVAASFKINGNSYTAGEELGPKCTLNDFIRNHAKLKGTKKMCGEGGCGCCVAHISYKDPSKNSQISRSINTCMMPVYACDGWEITTIEGLGDKRRGYHSIQKRLAEYNGTQCGYCSPGFVMNMYGILANDPKPTKQKIEDSFDGNICRCTGYRPILDAMKSFGDVNEVPDIEDVNKACCGKQGFVVCNNSCKDHNDEDYIVVPDGGMKNILHKDGEWHKPETLKDCYTLLKETEKKKVRLVVGNTGTGVFKYDGPYDHYIDIRNIPELHEVKSTDTELSFGATITLTELIENFKKKSEKLPAESQSSIWNYFTGAEDPTEGWEYCAALAHHISYIANTPVRNAGCWAGNLTMKHDHHDFPSDMFTIMETAGATLTVGQKDGSSIENVSPLDYINMKMDGKMLLKLTLKKLTSEHIMRTFKITIRSQNSHAYINAGFLFEVSKSEDFKVKSKPTIVFGGVSGKFVHATKTENLLNGALLVDPTTVEKALATLDEEIVPDSSDPVLSSAAYRKSLCVSLLYKAILGIIGDQASVEYQSGGPNMERPLSGGERTFYTNEEEWPLTKPVQKLEAMIQCSGEAQYSGDFQSLRGQLYGAFVLSSEANAKIDSIDSKTAMSIEGVAKVVTAKDIPGINDVAKAVPFFYQKEELLASTRVQYNGQAVAIVLAETEYIAEKAAKLVKVKYSDVKTPIITIKDAIAKKSFWKLPINNPVIAGNVQDGFDESHKVIDGEIEFGGQYHFHMETQTTYCVPTDLGLDVYSSTQSMNHCQGAISDVTGLKKHEINMIVKRVGGGYGAKLMKSYPVAAACALSSQATNRPVLMHLPLETNMRVIGKRLPYVAKYKVGVDAEGKFNAVQIDYYDDSGSGANEQTGTNVVQFGDSAYFCKNWKLQSFCVKTDTPRNCSCRAPAWLQAVSFMDEICENVAFQLGKEPIDIKALNFIKDGQKKANGQVILNCLIGGMVKEFKEMSLFEKRKTEIKEFNENNRWKKKGLACCMMRYPHSYFAIKFNANIAIYANDGTVAISHGGIEMGQGINTKAAQVCAYEFGIPLSMVKVKETSSIVNPNQTLTGGSIGSDLVSFAVMRTCEILNKRMAPIKKKMKNPTWIELIKECEKNNMDLCARNTYTPADVPGSYDIYGMTAAEIELDVLTGIVQIPRVDLLYDAGESTSPDVDIGQIEGAFMMGVGLMTSEQLKYELKSGELLTKNTWEYKPPTTKDIPIEFNIKFLKNSKNPLGVLGAKATGEPPLCMSSSVLFAIRDAIQSAREDAGHKERITISAPATPEFNQMNCLVSTDRMKI